jgi:predicted RNase H-like nuclease (RuvC/YqgF family)
MCPNENPEVQEDQEIDVTEIIERLEKVEKSCIDLEKENTDLKKRVGDCEDSIDALTKVE